MKILEIFEVKGKNFCKKNLPAKENTKKIKLKLRIIDRALSLNGGELSKYTNVNSLNTTRHIIPVAAMYLLVKFIIDLIKQLILNFFC